MTTDVDRYAPQVFGVEDLKSGNPRGRVIELRREADGKATVIERWEFIAVDPDTATIRIVTRDEHGATIEQRTASWAWTELLAHSQFPSAATTFEDGVRLVVPAGTYVTRRYTVVAGDAIRRFWFTAELPGPPVQFTTERAGTLALRVQMLRAR